MAKDSRIDAFSNRAYMNPLEVTPATLAFDRLTTGIGVGDNTAMIINRVEYYFTNAVLNLIVAEADALYAGVTISDGITGLDLNQAAVITMLNITEADFGTPASAQMNFGPFVQDFTTMPGGGLIVPGVQLYGAIQGISLASVASCEIRMWFNYKKMARGDYLELVQAMQVLT